MMKLYWLTGSTCLQRTGTFSILYRAGAQSFALLFSMRVKSVDFISDATAVGWYVKGFAMRNQVEQHLMKAGTGL